MRQELMKIKLTFFFSFFELESHLCGGVSFNHVYYYRLATALPNLFFIIKYLIPCFFNMNYPIVKTIFDTPYLLPLSYGLANFYSKFLKGNL